MKHFWNLSRKIILTFLLPTMAIILITDSISLINNINLTQTSFINDTTDKMASTTELIEDHYLSDANTVQDLAQSFEAMLNQTDLSDIIPNIMYATLSNHSDVLDDYFDCEPNFIWNNANMSYFGYFDCTFEYNTTGQINKIFYDVNNESSPDYLANQSWFTTAMQFNTFHWSDPYYDPDILQTTMISALAPIINATDGTPLGYVGMDVPLSYISNYLASLNLGYSSSYSFMIQQDDGAIITYPNASETFAETYNENNGEGYLVSNLTQNNDAQWQQVYTSMESNELGNALIDNQYVFYQPLPTLGFSIAFVFPESQVMASTTTQEIQVLWEIIITIIILIGLSVLIAHSIQKPIRLMQGFANKVSNNDMNAELSVHDNLETGQLAEDLRSMAKSLAKNAEDNIQLSLELNKKAEIIASSATEFSASSENIASSQQQIAKGASSQVTNITQTQQSLVELSNGIKQTNLKLDEISNISALLNQISDQTNMLALNAAIEASRAGEAGVGFNVVADQVRQLSDQSRISVKKTNESIEQIRAIAMIQQNKALEINKQVDNIASVAEEIAASTEESSAAAEEQAASMESITETAQELLITSENIKKRLENIKIQDKTLISSDSAKIVPNKSSTEKTESVESKTAKPSSDKSF